MAVAITKASSMTHADGAAASTAARRRRNMKWGGRKVTVRCGRMLMNGDNAMRRKGSFCERRKHARCVHAELQQPSEVEVVATSAVLGRDAQRRRSGRTCSCSCAAGDELEVQSSPPLAPLMGEKHEGEEKEGEHGIDMRAASSSAAMELDDDAHEGGDKKTMGVGMFQSESEADGPPRHGQRRTTAKFKIVRVFSGLVAGAIGAFVTFSGGTVFGVLGFLFAPQVSRALLNSERMKKLLGDGSENLEVKTRRLRRPQPATITRARPSRDLRRASSLFADRLPPSSLLTPTTVCVCVRFEWCLRRFCR